MPALARPAETAATARGTVKGVVRNVATGDPLPRALVSVEGDASTGALTDSDGRFEIPDLPTGPQTFRLLKPGFRDRPSSVQQAIADEEDNSTHNVLVAAAMPDLSFFMAPAAVIRGRVELSTGDPAQGVSVSLLRRTVLDGRAAFQFVDTVRTNSDGAYRFAGLGDGVYALNIESALESEPATALVETGSGAAIERSGYPSVYYPDSRDLAGAAKLHLSSGEEAQANFHLTLEPFHTVTATFIPPHVAAPVPETPGGARFAAAVLQPESEGAQLPYVARLDRANNVVQADLPDGSYSLLVWLPPAPMRIFAHGEGREAVLGQDPNGLRGFVDFTVAGRVLSNLRIPLSVPPANSVQLTLLHSDSGSSPALPPQGGLWPVGVFASVNGPFGVMNTVFAMNLQPGSNPAASLGAGMFWLHPDIGLHGFCEQSLTAGGANLAREPMRVGISGAVPPVTLTLRDDCAKIALSLPPGLAAILPGEEPSYTVYLVPEFDSTRDIPPLILRASTGATQTVEDLTPGNYRVYTFDTPVRLEYRNPAALAELPIRGQSVALSPGATANLTVEVPSRQ